MDDNFDAPELMDDDNAIDDYNDDDDGNNAAEDVEVKCHKIKNSAIFVNNFNNLNPSAHITKSILYSTLPHKNLNICSASVMTHFGPK